MNSNYAASRVRETAGFVPAKASQAFASVLRSTPEPEAQIQVPDDETLPAETPGRSRTAQIPEEPAEAPEPAAPPARSRTSQAADGPAEPARRSTVPHFLSVPDAVQYPNGPYRQAPAEHGGEWWLTNPFTGTEPWLTQGFADPYAPPAPHGPEASPEFLAVFGPRPNADTHPNRLLRGAAIADWERRG